MRFTVLLAASAFLLSMATGCGSDSMTPGSTQDPPPSPSPQDGLWTVSGAPSALLQLSPTQLSDTGTRDPVTTVTTASAWLYPKVAVAFDPDGNLWIASRSDSVLLAFAPGDLAGSGSRTATRVISSVTGSLSGPTGLAFDAHHRLWVVNSQSAKVVRFDPAQLAAGGAQVPAVILSLPGNPTSLAFDAAGSLWVGDNQFHTIARYPAAALEASGSPAETFRLTRADSLMNPSGIAFDAVGNLWVANTNGHNLLSFSSAQLAGTTTSRAHIVIGSNAGSLNVPVGLAFDGGGNLWVVGTFGSLTQFAKASLGTTGAPAPRARLQISGHSLLWSLAFWPRPAGVPLN